MNIILFGGSFNPPHIGHQIVIAQAFELLPQIDQLWLLPDYRHSFAKNSNLAAPHHRLKMAQFLENHQIRTETCTFDHKMSGNTIEHITFLKKKRPQHQFSFLMGSDNLKSFTKWPKWQTLLKLMPFYIYPRANVPMKPLYANMHPLKSPDQVVTNISSTLIRHRIKQKLPINLMVPDKVLKYLNQHQLYL